MPIEIRELSVKVNISDSSNSSGSTSQNRPSINKAQLIKECMDQVSEMIKNKKER